MARREIWLALAVFLAGRLPAGAQSQALVDAGGGVYEDNCASCHGDQLRNPGSAFDLRELGPEERSRFDESVLNGKGQMPPWKGALSTEQLDQLWAYIRSHAN